MQTPADMVIEHFGVRPLARLMGLKSPSTITRWRKAGVIPAQYQQQIIELSGGKFTAHDLVYGRE